ncbi:hypothetical protein [Prosthecobacter sp.]|uniref:hypothetical protein n=1 Tax=Prosthecobacter sp. TaxID=1965333 RepID=UPI002ABBFADC|nr:hypothetical protein [Prosthecobacter sp.]MDZ4404445.1 hypothetical protein [Prosthecobacter sp.]
MLSSNLLLAGVLTPLLLTAQTAVTVQPELPPWQAKLADPACRQSLEQANDVSAALQELEVSPFDHAAFYDWLRAQAKPPQQHIIECLLLAHLARELQRSETEISAADDLVLQAAPNLPQGWFGRAEQYAAATQKESAAWAAEAAVQGMRRVDLASAQWPRQLQAYRGVDWLAHAVKSGHLTEWVKAVAAALEHAPQGMARPDACRLVLTILRHDAMRQEPLLGQILLESVQTAQPQLVLGDPANFAVVLRDLQAAGQPALAQRVARLLVLAPVPKDAVSGAGGVDLLSITFGLRSGFSELLGLWEDTTTPHQPTTQARQILHAALGDEPAFAETCLQAAQTQPWNENLVTHALLALALNGGVSPEQMKLAANLSVDSRARVALRLAAFAPPGSHPQSTSGPWLEELALSLVTKMQYTTERGSFESLLNCLEHLQRGGEQARLTRVLEAARNSTPRLDDLDHWERHAQLILRQKNLALTRTLATAWGGALDQTSQQKTHLLPLARTAILAGKNGGVEFAMMALTLWERHHAEMSSTSLPPPGEAARVGEALMACDYLEGFNRFVTGLEHLQKHRVTSLYKQMTGELVALRDLIEGKGDLVPVVEAWVRPPAVADEAVTVQWQFVLPELGSSPDRAMILTTGDRDGRKPSDKLADARWWRAGTSLSALARLSGTCSIEILAGDDPDKLRSLVTIPSAPARGSHPIITLPASGCLKVMLRSQANGMTAASEPRAFSTRPPLFTNGREPAAAEEISAVACPDLTQVPQPEQWLPEDAKRWGRVIAPPVEIEDAAEYVLTQWSDTPFSNTRMILLDAEQRPLGPVPVASMGWQAGSLALTHTPVNRVSRSRAQRFRPGDWAGDGDLVFPSDGRAGEQKARYIAFVTREVAPKTLPLLQLRPYRTASMPGKADPSFRSFTPELPELNDEYIGDLGFAVHSWHVTFASDRGIITGKGALAGFDVMHIPWKPLVRAESELIEGNEWPMVFTPEHSLVIEPSWNGTRNLGLRFVPFDVRGERYAACRRIELPLPSYSRGEISEWLDGAVLMVSSQRGENPEPACAWVEPDGKCHVVKLPRPPIKNSPGLEIAWWGPGGTKFTLHEDGLLFHMEHRDGLRLLSVEPGTPDDMPAGCKPGRSKRKRAWRLERPDVLVQMDKKTSMITRRFHLPKPCAGTPMAFDTRGYVILFTTDHEIIRVNPPGRIAIDN